jgi:hypothetical protein
VVLSAAQLAAAREHSFRSWPALKVAVERDRSMDLSANRRFALRSALPGLLVSIPMAASTV